MLKIMIVNVTVTLFQFIELDSNFIRRDLHRSMVNIYIFFFYCTEH